MKNWLPGSVNQLLIIASTVFLANLQTSLWPNLFGAFPAPMLWIPSIIFIAINRTLKEGLIAVVLISLILPSLSSMIIGHMILINLTLFFTLRFVKERFYWQGPSYVILASAGAALLFHVYHLAYTLVIDDHPISSPDLVRFIGEVSLTPVVGPVLYSWMQKIDAITKKEPIIEESGPKLV